MQLLIIYFVLSIFFSFICSIMEAVLLSLTPAYINGLNSKNPSLAKQLKEYKKDIDKPLSAILTLNTIAHTVGAILVGVQASTAFGETPFTIPFTNFTLSFESLVAGIMTLAILILSEIIPKTIGASHWRKLTPIVASSLKIITFLLAPFVWLSMRLTKYFKSSEVHSVLSREDYRAMTDLGGESGALQESEHKMIGNLLNLDQITLKSVMTPRTVLHAVDEKMTLTEYYKSHNDMPFSRIPIYEGDLDHLSGFVLKDDILSDIIEGKGDQQLKSLSRKIQIENEDKTLRDFFKSMSKNNQHIATVTDEYGMVSGLVSLEDILETILGFEIIDENDNIADLQAYAKNKWEERAKKIGITK